MKLEELHFAQTHLQDPADLLTWSHALNNAKAMWRACARLKTAISEGDRTIEKKTAAGYAMMFLQMLWVIPKDWHNVKIMTPMRSMPELQPTYAETEARAYTAISTYYEHTGERWKDPLHRHFEVNRILRHNQATENAPFNPHLLRKANRNEMDL